MNFRVYSSGLIAALVMSSFFVAAQSKSDPAVLEAQADTLMGKEDYAGALALYDKIVQASKFKSPDDYKVYYKRAFSHYGLEHYAEALKDVNQYLEKFPDDQAKLLRTYINQGLGNTEAQLEDLNAFLAANPANTDLLRWRASVLMEAERYDDARRDIRQLMAYQPGPELKSYLGLCYFYEHNIDSALATFDEVIASNPEIVQTYLYAGSLCLDEEQYDAALFYIDKGLKQEPSNNTLLFYRGIALVEKDNVKDGCRCLSKAFAAGLDDAGQYLKQYCYGSE
ncbi:tetratricopeptide repeat protein [Chryseolinea sp. Jin1]|uniref:Tetratricopeptide repeat protein n=2 Tax=Chryseolinea lacunae TaxID=2801331 RepID=A0ABS1KLT7_9BACT|nr:tetratricopeptide repeat protein [Chryseolinea lacunae]